jgi:hypothetical protein
MSTGLKFSEVEKLSVANEAAAIRVKTTLDGSWVYPATL